MTERFHPRGRASRGWIVFALLPALGCKEAPVDPPDSAPIGIEIPAHGDRPPLEVAVRVDPAPEDISVVTVISGVVAGAIQECSSEGRLAEPIGIDARVVDGVLRDLRPSAGDPLSTCIERALDGVSVDAWGSEARVIELQIRAKG